MRIDGLAIMVTGASSGIGRETTLLLARQGASVLAVARSQGRLAALAAEQPGITPVVADLTAEAERARVMDAAGPLDVLVNNAGLGWIGKVEDMPAADVRHLVELNLLALIDLTQRALPAMLAKRSGLVVNMASAASWVSIPPLTMYSATKFAVQGFSDGLRRELAGSGVGVATVNPGPVKTHFATRAQIEDRPTDDLPDHGMPGVPAALVAHAVARAIRRRHVPGYATIAVPRVFGLARFGALPGLRYTTDALALVTRRYGLR
ncbi:MAG: SDR family NAD(P)-dependent oxidoreductase [Acidimicrobiales bacterium]